MVFDGPAAEIIREHADELVRMGVWLPGATLAALRLREHGYAFAVLPLTPDELAGALADDSSRSARSATGFPTTGIPTTGVPTSEGPAKTGIPASEDVRSPSGGRSDQTSLAEPIIRARGLTVRRRRTEILHGIDLDLEAGSLTAIVGANGAGKTTLIQALAGVVPPPRGQVVVDGIDPGTASPRDLAARVGFVFENPEHQFIAHTVFDELAHGLRLRNVPEDEIATRVDEMLTRFGLELKKDVHPFLLSGGEKRRLSVGTALITRPRVLALDEPTFGQDRARAAELLDLLAGLRAEGTTIVIVTHDLQLVAEHTSHVVILANGRVRATGPTATLFQDEQLFSAAGLRMPALQRVLASAGLGVTS